MRVASFAAVTLVTVLLIAPATSSAQARARRQSTSTSTGGLFDITPYAGYVVFGNFLTGPLGTALTNKPAPIYGAQLGMKIAPNVSMIGNIATASSDVQIGVPYLGGISVASSSMLFYDAGLELDIPVTSAYGYTFSPFVQAGVGGMHYEITQSFISTTATNLAGTVAAGADIAIGGGVGLRLMAKDYFGKFNFQDATSFDINGGTTQNFAFSAGLRVSF